MPFIEVIEYEKSNGPLREIYDHLIETRGKLAEVHKIQSLNPGSIMNHIDLYLTVMFGRSPVKRYQREMMAVVVSVANECRYCMQHHGEALNHFWKDDKKMNLLYQDYNQLKLKPLDKALCDYAHSLTVTTGRLDEGKYVEPLRKAGLEDRGVLDAAMVISYFNFVNRMVNGLGIDIEPEGAGGYNYD